MVNSIFNVITLIKMNLDLKVAYNYLGSAENFLLIKVLSWSIVKLRRVLSVIHI